MSLFHTFVSKSIRLKFENVLSMAFRTFSKDDVFLARLALD